MPSNKPNTKGQVMCDSTWGAPRIGKFIDTESRMEATEVTRSWGKGE